MKLLKVLRPAALLLGIFLGFSVTARGFSDPDPREVAYITPGSTLTFLSTMIVAPGETGRRYKSIAPRFPCDCIVVTKQSSSGWSLEAGLKLVVEDVKYSRSVEGKEVALYFAHPVVEKIVCGGVNFENAFTIGNVDTVLNVSIVTAGPPPVR